MYQSFVSYCPYSNFSLSLSSLHGCVAASSGSIWLKQIFIFPVNPPSYFLSLSRWTATQSYLSLRLVTMGSHIQAMSKCGRFFQHNISKVWPFLSIHTDNNFLQILYISPSHYYNILSSDPAKYKCQMLRLI